MLILKNIQNFSTYASLMYVKIVETGGNLKKH